LEFRLAQTKHAPTPERHVHLLQLPAAKDAKDETLEVGSAAVSGGLINDRILIGFRAERKS
jgi:hypothetical protein